MTNKQAYAGLLERLNGLKPFEGTELREAAEAISSLLKAGNAVLARFDDFMTSNDGFMGNHADAYQILVKRAFEDWKQLRAALNSDAPADKPRVCKRCGTPEGEPHRFRHIPKYVEVPDNSDAPLSIGEGL